MLPDFGAMQEGLSAIVALLERGVVALESIAECAKYLPVFEGHLDPHTGAVTGEWRYDR